MLRIDLLGDVNDSMGSSDRRSSIETTPIRNGGKPARKETSKNIDVKLAQIRIIYRLEPPRQLVDVCRL